MLIITCADCLRARTTHNYMTDDWLKMSWLCPLLRPPVWAKFRFVELFANYVVLWKAKTFGTETAIYRIADAADNFKGGHRYTFYWIDDWWQLVQWYTFVSWRFIVLWMIYMLYGNFLVYRLLKLSRPWRSLISTMGWQGCTQRTCRSWVTDLGLTHSFV